MAKSGRGVGGDQMGAPRLAGGQNDAEEAAEVLDDVMVGGNKAPGQSQQSPRSSTRSARLSGSSERFAGLLT